MLLLLSRDCSPFRRPAAVVAQRHIHENVFRWTCLKHITRASVSSLLFAALLGKCAGLADET